MTPIEDPAVVREVARLIIGGRQFNRRQAAEILTNYADRLQQDMRDRDRREMARVRLMEPKPPSVERQK